MKGNKVLSYALKTTKEINLTLSPKLPWSQKRTAIELIGNIFYNYIDVIQDKILTDEDIEDSLNEVNDISGHLCDLLNSKDYLLSWIYIGDTVNDWQKMAIELEEYEIASNLKRLFNNTDKHDQE